jgi:hypothetical protein
MIPNNLPAVEDIKKISSCWGPLGPIGIEIDGVLYKEPEATEICKYYGHIIATNIVNKYRSSITTLNENRGEV